jgi:hypothetical protein
MFANAFARFPPDNRFWDLAIGDPQTQHLFDNPVYVRGAMTLQALRVTVGDAAFFAILRAWAATNAGAHGTTPEFIALAEQISGRQLGALFDAWLFSPDRPALPPATEAMPLSGPTVDSRVHAWSEVLDFRLAREAVVDIIA